MIVGSRVILRGKKLADARWDYIWQTDPELARLDAISPLAMTFAQYLSDYASELCCSPRNRRHFAIETLDGKYIGNCSYYNFNEARDEAELGIMIGDRDYWDVGYGADAITIFVSHLFRQTKLKRVYLKTLDSNRRAQRCFEKCGFTACGRLVRNGFNFMLMEIHRKQWQERPGQA